MTLYTRGGKQATETACENDQILDLTDKDFKVTIINIFRELKETMIKEVMQGLIKCHIKWRISIQRNY